MRNKTNNKILKIVVFLLCLILLGTTSCSKECIVTFDEENQQIVNYGSYIEEPTSPTKEGYNFIGWYNGDELFSFDTKIKKNLNLVSKFEIKTFDITFVSDDTNVIKINYNAKVEKPIDPIKKGYTFINWYEGETVFDFNQEIKEEHTITAKFEINKYTVIYEVNKEVIETKEVEYGSTIKCIEAPNIKGKTFLYWSLDGEEYDFTSLIEDNIVLQGTYEIRKCNIIFDNDGTKIIQQVEYGSRAHTPAFDKVEDAEFLGWYDGKTLFNFDTVITKDYLITAKYKFVTYNVLININGDITTNVVRANKTIDKPKDPKVKGFKFIGWSVDGEPFDFSTKITKDITITALFDYIYYTVTFENDNETSTQKVIEGYIAVKPMSPVKTNKIFDGWYLGDKEFKFSQPITEDIKLVAHYSDYKTDKIYVTYDFGYDCYQTKSDLRYSYYSEYYNFLTSKGFNFASKSIANVDNFIRDMTNFSYNGRREMGALGDAFSSNYMNIVKGGSWEDQSINNFMGYCYQNNKFMDLLYHLQEFFSYWRTDEGYSQGDANGNDWFASGWASYVDTAKFFYFTTDNLYDEYSWFTSPRVHYMLDNVPGVGYKNLVYSSTDPIELPLDVTRIGYTFLGWFDENGKPVTTVTKSMTVFAKWKEGPVKTIRCLAKAATSGSETYMYAATPSQTANAYLYGPRVIIASNESGYFVQSIIPGDGTKNPDSYAYRIVAYNKKCYNEPSYLIKVGQKVTVKQDGDYLVFEFYN